MRTLVIDTSGVHCSLALIEDDDVVAARHEAVGRGHAEILLPWIAGLPDGGRCDRIVAGCGPGSFTGVRVGIAAARGLGIGWRIPVFGLPSFALIAAAARGESCLVAIEGGHGQIFVQPWDLRPLEPAGALLSLPADAAAALPGDVLAGNAAGRLCAMRGGGSAIEADADARRFVYVPDVLLAAPPRPIYGRAPDARLPAP